MLETVSEEQPLPVNKTTDQVANSIDESISLLCTKHRLNKDTCLHYDEEAEEQAAHDNQQRMET